ncbi:MAG: alpha/beta fold hydrolase [Pseudomonadota bacterium]
MDEIESTVVKFRSEDDWLLEGDLFVSGEPEFAVLISAGTGFPRQFYKNIAKHLARKGAAVLTFDYRGIGGSKTGDLKNSPIEYIDWAKDQAAAVDVLKERFPDLEVTHIAHSVGGHFIGFIRNQSSIKKHALVSVGTGYFGGHHLKNIPMELYFWWILGSVSLAIWGYVKPVAGWKGAPLPPRVFTTWRRWSHKRDYFKSELGKELGPHHFDEVTNPIRSWIFLDDPIATPRSSGDMLSCYPNAPTEIVLRSPDDFAVKRIGHEGAFRPGREALWDEIWDWLISED